MSGNEGLVIVPLAVSEYNHTSHALKELVVYLLIDGKIFMLTLGNRKYQYLTQDEAKQWLSYRTRQNKEKTKKCFEQN